jgi:hypothetical protein
VRNVYSFLVPNRSDAVNYQGIQGDLRGSTFTYLFIIQSHVHRVFAFGIHSRCQHDLLVHKNFNHRVIHKAVQTDGTLVVRVSFFGIKAALYRWLT